MHTVKVSHDTYPDDPRSWDNLGTMVCFHGRYNLGDKHSETPDSLKAIAKRSLCLPLYLYDHSGITMATKPFHCPWDSGQVGYIYVTQAKIKEWLGVKTVTDKVKERVLAMLQNEVDCYNTYLIGEVYQYSVLDESGEVVDSCCGYYGDYGMKEIEDMFKDKSLYNLVTEW